MISDLPFRDDPAQEAHWPFAQVGLAARLQNLYLSGIVGVVIAHTQGNSRQSGQCGRHRIGRIRSPATAF